MEYAPIIIPTLNRIDHLKRCLTSLENNTGAENTEVYISVDYPPAEKYVAGYLEVKTWLKQNALNLRFKKMHLYFQEENLGAVKNIFFLESQIREKYDRYIFSEDDNEFAPNFLMYINKGLEQFEDNPNVFGICAAKDTEWICSGKNITYAKLFPAYGFGSWFDKEKDLKERGQAFLLNTAVTLKPFNIWKLFSRNKCLFNIYISSVLCKDDGLFWQGENLYWCDSIKSIYMHFSEVICVVPAIAKSRTWGNDGSGLNMQAKDINPEERWPLDINLDFVYDSTEFVYNEKNYKLGDDYLKSVTSLKSTIKSIVLYVILMLHGKDRYKAMKTMKNLNLL